MLIKDMKLQDRSFEVSTFVSPAKIIFKDKKIYELASGVLTEKVVDITEKEVQFKTIELSENDFYSVKEEFPIRTSELMFNEFFRIGSLVYFKFHYHEEDRYYSINVDGTALTELTSGTFPSKPAVSTTPDAIDGTYFYTETMDVSGVTHYRLRNKVHPEWVTSWETIYPQIIEDGLFLYVVFKDTVSGAKSGIYVVKHDATNRFKMLLEKLSTDFQIWE